jgi:hypothetical protein
MDLIISDISSVTEESLILGLILEINRIDTEMHPTSRDNQIMICIPYQDPFSHKEPTKKQ